VWTIAAEHEQTTINNNNNDSLLNCKMHKTVEVCSMSKCNKN